MVITHFAKSSIDRSGELTANVPFLVGKILACLVISFCDDKEGTRKPHQKLA